MTERADRMPLEKLQCDKCGSTDVKETAKHPPKEPDPIPMSEVGKRTQPKTVPLIVKYTDMIAKYRSCGYKVEYTIPNA